MRIATTEKGYTVTVAKEHNNFLTGTMQKQHNGKMIRNHQTSKEKAGFVTYSFLKSSFRGFPRQCNIFNPSHHFVIENRAFFKDDFPLDELFHNHDEPLGRRGVYADHAVWNFLHSLVDRICRRTSHKPFFCPKRAHIFFLTRNTTT